MNEILKGKFNIITEQNKISLITKILPEKLNLKNKTKILYLTKIKFENKFFQEWNENLQENKFCTLTYNKFGSLLKEKKINESTFDLIIIEDYLTLYNNCRFDFSKLIETHSDFSIDTVSFMLFFENNNYRCLETLRNWSKISDIYIVSTVKDFDQFLFYKKEIDQFMNMIFLRTKICLLERN